MDGRRFGSALRVVRVERGWRQAELARAAGVSDATVSRAERGRVDGMAVSTLERLSRALDIRVDLVVLWHGGDLARLLNRRHSLLHESVARWFSTVPGWVLVPEVTFSAWGERGVIDGLAWHAASRSLLVLELKSEIVDVQEMIGTLDRKHRLAPRVAADRGWEPRATGAWIIVADGRTNRRRLALHRTVLRAAFPSDGRSMEAWVRRPSGSISALSLWPDSRGVSTTQVGGQRRRVRRRNLPLPRAGET